MLRINIYLERVTGAKEYTFWPLEMDPSSTDFTGMTRVESKVIALALRELADQIEEAD